MSNRILVSHESPISILDQSVAYNDFDYALVHLFEKSPEYYDFFRWMAFGWFLYTNYILLLICLFLFQCGKIFGFWI